jgi:GMP synthase (glutamine-hydrolysing)
LAKVIVIQHVAFEPLGTIVSLLRERKHRIRHVNFIRTPDLDIELANYDALIVLGGPMHVDHVEQYPFLLKEMQIIRDAMALDMPVLGICLGAQLIAKALGADVYPATEKEVGWYPIHKTDAESDPICQYFSERLPIFQWHGYTFDLPSQAQHLLGSDICPNQAFKVGENVYGFQFHLEITQHLIERWLNQQASLEYLQDMDTQQVIDKIRADTKVYIQDSIQLSHQVFGAFLDLLPQVKVKHRLRSR